MKMITTLTNFGDSFGIQLPKSLVKSVPIFENDDVEVFVIDNSIIIRRIERKNTSRQKNGLLPFVKQWNKSKCPKQTGANHKAKKYGKTG